MPDAYPIIVPIYSYYAQSPLRFEYQNHPDLKKGWTRIGIAFFAFGKDQPGVVPVYQYYTENPWRSMYSTNANNPPAPGWKKGNIAFHAFEKFQPNTIAVARHLAYDPRRYMYSTDPNSDDPWGIDGIAFFGFAAMPPQILQESS